MRSVGALRAKAVEVRQLAETSKDIGIKNQLAHLAERFDHLAEQAEQGMSAAPRATPAPAAQTASS